MLTCIINKSTNPSTVTDLWRPVNTENSTHPPSSFPISCLYLLIPMYKSSRKNKKKQLPEDIVCRNKTVPEEAATRTVPRKWQNVNRKPRARNGSGRVELMTRSFRTHKSELDRWLRLPATSEWCINYDENKGAIRDKIWFFPRHCFTTFTTWRGHLSLWLLRKWRKRERCWLSTFDNR